MGAAPHYDRASLPNNVEALKQVIAEQRHALAQQDQVIAENQQRIAVLEEFIRLQKLKQFAARSEKAAGQAELFNEAELSVAAEALLDEAEAQDKTTPAARTRKKPAGRKPLPQDLPRVRIEHDVSATEKYCHCGCQREPIGEESSEQLDIVPAQIRVLVNVRKKYACKQCQGEIITAALPAQPIPKSNASAGLLAHVVVAKYQDALPLHRQEAMFKRHGIELPRHTLANWMIKAGDLIQPLINLMQDRLCAYPVLHCDETRVQVLQDPDKPAPSQSYMWVRVGGSPRQPVRLFDYASSRSAEVASGLLSGYQGYLQTDDYAGYNGIAAEPGVTQLGCWAHARRKFIEAQKATAGKSRKTGKADMAISLISKLYVIEQKIRDLSAQQKYQIRQAESVPQLQKIRDWVDKTLHSTLPKGLLGKALAYLDRNWSKLTLYTEDGRLSIDNNAAENAIRPFVIGRKNWLFSASIQGAKASANLYSLIETAKANGLEPYAYLRHVFNELPKATSVAQIESLLPWYTKTES